MIRRFSTFAVLSLVLTAAACASKPVSDPGGKWAKQTEMIDNSLFQ